MRIIPPGESVMKYQITCNHKRAGGTMVEFAVVVPVLILLLIGMIVMGLGVFRYLEVAHLARDGARFAIVRGTQYRIDTGNTPATTTDIETYIKSKAVGLDSTQLTITTTWDKSNSPAYANPSSTPPGQPVGNKVAVTVSYNWIPEVFFGGITLTSQSIMPMAY